ncbi:MAG: hypothetical protein ACI845_003671 [Gammaproteobacteria bacterium]|jgi:hypothetical protein
MKVSGDATFDDVHDLSKIELLALVQELLTHQIELEMQNDALKESESKYENLFNSAPWVI